MKKNLLIVLFLTFCFYLPVPAFAQDIPTGGLLIKALQLQPLETARLLFSQGSQPFNEQSKIAEIKAVNYQPPTAPDKLSSFIELRSKFEGSQNAGIKILPDGSVVAGGLSTYEFPVSPTSATPLDIPYGIASSGVNGRQHGVIDFMQHLPREDRGDNYPQAGTFVRNLTLHDTGKPSQFVTSYAIGKCAGCPAWEGRGTYAEMAPWYPASGAPASLNWMAFDAIEGYTRVPAAAIYARISEEVRSGGPIPSSLFFATKGNDTPPEGDETVRMIVYADGKVAIGNNTPQEKLHVFGSIGASGSKFMIDHPTKPGQKLVHAAIEGPESAVYYRGEAQLVNGKAEIQLPDYFEKLTRIENRTVFLSSMDYETLSVISQNGSQIKDGKFIVKSKTPEANGKFEWEVVAIRADIDKLEVER